MIRFLLVFGVTAVVGFVFLLPLRSLSAPDFRPLLRLALHSDRVAMLGDSAIATSSHCDVDKALIPEMLSRSLHEPVVDGARGGATLGASLDTLRAVSLMRRIDVVVLPVTLNGGLFRSIRSGSSEQRLWHDIVAGLTYAPKPLPMHTPFKGRVYGGYEENAARYFTKEKAAMNCPEGAGKDLAFVEYMYWNSYGQSVNPDAGFPLFLSQVEWLQQRGVVTLVVLPPVNYQLIERLNDPPVMDNLRRVTAETERKLQAAHVAVLNIAFALTADAFADQWCACGHLTEIGRKEYARLVAVRVKALLDGRMGISNSHAVSETNQLGKVRRGRLAEKDRVSFQCGLRNTIRFPPGFPASLGLPTDR